MNDQTLPNNSPTRREFIKTSSILMAGTTLGSGLSLMPKAQAADQQTLRIGLVGCGGRGTGAAAQAMAADKNVLLTAVGDAFEDRLQVGLNSLQKASPDKVQVPKEGQFVGLDAYQKVINSGV